MSSASKDGLNFSTAEGSLTSSCAYCRPSRCEPSSGEYSDALARVPQTATRAPLVRNACAMPLPMPLEPPTTSACLPLKSSSFIAALPLFFMLFDLCADRCQPCQPAPRRQIPLSE